MNSCNVNWFQFVVFRNNLSTVGVRKNRYRGKGWERREEERLWACRSLCVCVDVCVLSFLIYLQPPALISISTAEPHRGDTLPLSNDSSLPLLRHSAHYLQLFSQFFSAARYPWTDTHTLEAVVNYHFVDANTKHFDDGNKKIRLRISQIHHSRLLATVGSAYWTPAVLHDMLNILYISYWRRLDWYDDINGRPWHHTHSVFFFLNLFFFLLFLGSIDWMTPSANDHVAH